MTEFHWEFAFVREIPNPTLTNVRIERHLEAPNGPWFWHEPCQSKPSSRTLPFNVCDLAKMKNMFAQAKEMMGVVDDKKSVITGTTFVFVWYEKSKHRVFMDVGATVWISCKLFVQKNGIDCTIYDLCTRLRELTPSTTGEQVAAFEMHLYLATGVVPTRQKLLGFEGKLWKALGLQQYTRF